MADAPNDGRERTEQPTARRLQQARDEGRVARSPEVAAAAVLVAGALLLGGVAGGSLAGAATQVLRQAGAALALGGDSPLTLVTLTRQAGWIALIAWLPFALGVAAVGVAVQLAQTQGAITWKPLTPDLSRLSPAAGLKRLFGFDGLLTALKSLARLALLALVIGGALSAHTPEVLALSRSGPGVTAEVLRALAARLALTAGIAFLAVALFDYAFQWFKHRRSLRMTRDEVTREHRETEGDPILKARVRSFARSLARRRMMQDVPTADVVVVNPTHVAVALRYDPGEVPAPVVVAMGERRIAERIRALAEKAGVPVVQNIAVARALLATGAVGRPIPPALYIAVAEILAWVHRRHGLRHAGAGRAA